MVYNLQGKSRGMAVVAFARPGDAAVARAKTAGAKVILEPQDVFWGSRYGRIQDPFGHVWEFNAPLAGEQKPA